MTPWLVAGAPSSDFVWRSQGSCNKQRKGTKPNGWRNSRFESYDACMREADFEFNNIPRAYFITFRGYGTWLHGDKRGSVDRAHNRFGAARLMPNERRSQLNVERLKHKPVRLEQRQRLLVEDAIKEICKKRLWDLWVVNARTNHIHAVVTAPCKPEPVLTALKANATRKLREAGYCRNGESPWAKRGSKKYLWAEQDVIDAVVYVQYEQGE